MPEQALGGIPLDLGSFVADKNEELSFMVSRDVFMQLHFLFRLA